MRALGAALACGLLLTGCGAAANQSVAKPAPGAVPAVVPATSLGVGPAPATATAGVAGLDEAIGELNNQLDQLDADLASGGN